jgi:hypothetical protein
VRSHSQHSHEILIEEPVEGPSHSGEVRALVSMELSASYERLDFALAYFDAEEPQPLASTFAVPKHTGGRRRARPLFCRRRSLYCPWIMIHQCTRSRGELLPLYEQKSIKIPRRWESHRMTLHQTGRVASKRGRSPVSDAQGPPHSVIGVGRVFFGPTERRG